MSNGQKIIKYFAILLAVLIVASVISGMVHGLSFMGTIFSDKNEIIGELEDLNVKSDIKTLNIDVSSIDIKVLIGSEFSLKTNNKYISVEQDNDKLYITQKKHNWFHSSKGDLVIYIPNDMEFDEIDINSGAGQIMIDNLNVIRLNLHLGAGKTSINNLIVKDKARIETGAGAFAIEESIINNLDFDMGVGKVTMKTKLTGDNKLNSGIGEVILNLVGTKEDYKISVSKGIGSTIIGNEEANDDSVHGTGNNLVEIDGGIGSIKVSFVD